MLRAYYFHILFPKREDSLDILFKREIEKLFKKRDYEDNVLCIEGKELKNHSYDMGYYDMGVLIGIIFKDKKIIQIRKDIEETAKFFEMEYKELTKFDKNEIIKEDCKNTVIFIINNYK